MCPIMHTVMCPIKKGDTVEPMLEHMEQEMEIRGLAMSVCSAVAVASGLGWRVFTKTYLSSVQADSPLGRASSSSLVPEHACSPHA